MHVQTLPLGAPVNNPPLPRSQAFPNTPQARVNKLASALLVGLSAALVAGGIYLSIKALVILGSISTVISVAALVFNFSRSTSSQPPKNVNKAEEVLNLINTNTPGAQSSITSSSFWKGLSRDEDKKAFIRAWLNQGKLLELIPFEELDRSFRILAYEVIKEDPALANLKDFCRRYRCQELIQKMTYAELYDQEGLNVQILFATEPGAKTEKLKYIKRENRFGLDWEQWQKFKDLHAKFILCILYDLWKSRDDEEKRQSVNYEEKRQSVNYFVSNLFKKIDQINLIEDKKTNLLHLLRVAQFEFDKFAEQINNPDLTQDIIDYLKNK